MMLPEIHQCKCNLHHGVDNGNGDDDVVDDGGVDIHDGVCSSSSSSSRSK